MRHDALTYGLVNLLEQLLLVCIGHAFGIGPIVHIEPALTLAAIAAPVLLLLLENVEHLLGIHTSEPLVN